MDIFWDYTIKIWNGVEFRSVDHSFKFRLCLIISIKSKSRGGMNVSSRRATGFHKWTKTFELNFSIRKTLFYLNGY